MPQHQGMQNFAFLWEKLENCTFIGVYHHFLYIIFFSKHKPNFAVQRLKRFSCLLLLHILIYIRVNNIIDYLVCVYIKPKLAFVTYWSCSLLFLLMFLLLSPLLLSCLFRSTHLLFIFVIIAAQCTCQVLQAERGKYKQVAQKNSSCQPRVCFFFIVAQTSLTPKMVVER